MIPIVRRIAAGTGLALGILAVCAGSAVAQQDAGCDASGAVLRNFADAFLVARDSGGASVGSAGRDLMDTSEFALFKTEQAGWPADYVKAMSATFKAATAINERNGALAEGESEGLLALADVIAATTTARCGADIVPVFARAGSGDARACAAVIEALGDAEELVPFMMGGDNAFGGVMMLGLRMAAQEAAGVAALAQWSDATIASLTILASQADAYSGDDLVPNATTGARLVARLNAVADEARDICGGSAIPLLADARN